MSTRTEALKKFRQGQNSGEKKGGKPAEKPAESNNQSAELGHKPGHKFKASEVASLTAIELYYMPDGDNGSVKVLTYSEVQKLPSLISKLLVDNNSLTRKFFRLAGVVDGKAILGKRFAPVMELYLAHLLDADRRANGNPVVKSQLAPRATGEDVMDDTDIREEALNLAADAYGIPRDDESEESGGGGDGAPAGAGFTPEQLASLATALGPVLQPMIKDAVDAALDDGT